MEGETDDPTAPKRLILIAGAATSATMLVRPAMRDEQPGHPMEDPVQAWNPIGIGGFTDKNTVGGTFIGTSMSP